MRDIYKRDTIVQHWINKVKEANIPYQDKEDILKFIDFMLREGRSSLRVFTCIAVLLQAKKVIRKPFRECSKEDIAYYNNYIEDNYSLTTQMLRKSILKLFFKVVYGNNEYYPDAVRWIKLKVSKDKQRKEEQLSYDQFLTEVEIKLLIDTANTIQKKAFIAVGYETGARPEEMLNIRIKDILFDSKGAKVILRGKTVERVTRVIAYVSLLKQWLSIHPFKNDPNAYLWLAEASNHKWKPIGLTAMEKAFRTIMKRAGINNKRPRLYILRHSRATHLANKLTEAQMCAYFGWQLGTKVVQRYIHLAGVRTDDALLELAGVQVNKEESSALKVRYCKRCNEMLSPNHEFCIRCGYSDKDVIASDNVSNSELADRLNRLEDTLARLVSELKRMKENNEGRH